MYLIYKMYRHGFALDLYKILLYIFVSSTWGWMLSLPDSTIGQKPSNPFLFISPNNL